MAGSGSETAYDPNANSNYTRDVATGDDMAKATSKVDPRLSGATADRPGRPKREDFPEGLDGMAQFTKAVRSWQSKNDATAKDADTAQKKALSRMQ